MELDITVRVKATVSKFLQYHRQGDYLSWKIIYGQAILLTSIQITMKDSIRPFTIVLVI